MNSPSSHHDWIGSRKQRQFHESVVFCITEAEFRILVVILASEMNFLNKYLFIGRDQQNKK
jgi:hypothetical protein